MCVMACDECSQPGFGSPRKTDPKTNFGVMPVIPASILPQHPIRLLKICSLAGGTLATISTDESMAVLDAKRAVQTLVEVPYLEQSWIFGFDLLDDAQSLGSLIAEADQSLVVTMVRDSLEEAVLRHARNLSSDSAARRDGACRALEEFGPAATGQVPALLQLLSDTDISVFHSTCCALTALDQLSSSLLLSNSLLRIVRSPESPRHEAALLTYVAVVGLHLPCMVAGFGTCPATTQTRLKTFCSVGVKDTSRLAERAACTLQAILSRDHTFRSTAVLMLARFPLEIVVPRLDAMLDNPDGILLVSIFELLAQLPQSVSAKYAETVVGFAAHPNAAIRAMACKALGSLGPHCAPSHLECLVACLLDGDESVRKMARFALRRLSPTEGLRFAVSQARDRRPRGAFWRWSGCGRKLRRALRTAVRRAYGSEASTQAPQARLNNATTKTGEPPQRGLDMRSQGLPVTAGSQIENAALPVIDPPQCEVCTHAVLPETCALSREEILASLWSEREGQQRHTTSHQLRERNSRRITQRENALRQRQRQTARRYQRDAKAHIVFYDELRCPLNEIPR